MRSMIQILNFLLDLGYAVTTQWNDPRESASGNVLVDGESAPARSAAVAGRAGMAAPAESTHTIGGTDDFLLDARAPHARRCIFLWLRSELHPWKIPTRTSQNRQ